MIDQKIINKLLKANTSSALEDIIDEIKDDREWCP